MSDAGREARDSDQSQHHVPYHADGTFRRGRAARSHDGSPDHNRRKEERSQDRRLHAFSDPPTVSAGPPVEPQLNDRADSLQWAAVGDVGVVHRRLDVGVPKLATASTPARSPTSLRPVAAIGEIVGDACEERMLSLTKSCMASRTTPGLRPIADQCEDESPGCGHIGDWTKCSRLQFDLGRQMTCQFRHGPAKSAYKTIHDKQEGQQ